MGYVKLSLEWLLVSAFWLGSDTSGIFSLHFSQPSFELVRDQHDWKMLIRYCRTDICSCKISAKVSLILDNPFLVPSLCKLNQISLCFIQISTKFAYSLQGKQCFFLSHLRCLGPLGKFQHNIYIKTARVSRLSFSYDNGFSWCSL